MQARIRGQARPPEKRKLDIMWLIQGVLPGEPTLHRSGTG
jgi:hypothetical protein